MPKPKGVQRLAHKFLAQGPSFRIICIASSVVPLSSMAPSRFAPSCRLVRLSPSHVPLLLHLSIQLSQDVQYLMASFGVRFPVANSQAEMGCSQTLAIAAYSALRIFRKVIWHSIRPTVPGLRCNAPPLPCLHRHIWGEPLHLQSPFPAEKIELLKHEPDPLVADMGQLASSRRRVPPRRYWRTWVCRDSRLCA